MTLVDREGIEALELKRNILMMKVADLESLVVVDAGKIANLRKKFSPIVDVLLCDVGMLCCLFASTGNHM